MIRWPVGVALVVVAITSPFVRRQGESDGPVPGWTPPGANRARFPAPFGPCRFGRTWPGNALRPTPATAYRTP